MLKRGIAVIEMRTVSVLQEQDRSQLYYCDPELQHISIYRRILSLLYQSNVFGLQS